MKQLPVRDAWLRRALVILALLVPWMVRADVPVPPLKVRVTDLTATLSSEQQATLEETLRSFEARKGSQIAVLIVPTTRPETIEQYSIRVVEQWKLGRNKADDGVLLLVAKDDRGVRIEIGYGLEGVLTDAAAKRIIAEEIVPRFRHDDFIGGINGAVGRMIRAIDGERLPPVAVKPAPVPPSRTDSSGGSGSAFGMLVAGVAIGVVLLAFWICTQFGIIFGSAIPAVAIGGWSGWFFHAAEAAAWTGTITYVLAVVCFSHLMCSVNSSGVGPFRRLDALLIRGAWKAKQRASVIWSGVIGVVAGGLFGASSDSPAVGLIFGVIVFIVLFLWFQYDKRAPRGGWSSGGWPSGGSGSGGIFSGGGGEFGGGGASGDWGGGGD